MFMDLIILYIYLPFEACQAFEKQFNLQYNSTLLSYIVSDKQHDLFMAIDISIIFTIADSKEGRSSVDIILLYSSFDLELKSPYAPETTRYFPIQRA